MPYRDGGPRAQARIVELEAALARAEADAVLAMRARVRGRVHVLGWALALGAGVVAGALPMRALPSHDHGTIALVAMSQTVPARNAAVLTFEGTSVEPSGGRCELRAAVSVSGARIPQVAVTVRCGGVIEYRSWDEVGDGRVLSRCGLGERAVGPAEYEHTLRCFDQGPRTLRRTLSVDTEARELLVGSPAGETMLRVRLDSPTVRRRGLPLLATRASAHGRSRSDWAGTVTHVSGRAGGIAARDPAVPHGLARGTPCHVTAMPLSADDGGPCWLQVSCSDRTLFAASVECVLDRGDVVAAADDVPSVEAVPRPIWPHAGDPIVHLDARGRRLTVADRHPAGDYLVAIRLDRR